MIYFVVHESMQYLTIYIVAKTREFSENNVLYIAKVELCQLKLHIVPHVVALCFTCADDDNDLLAGAEDGWVRCS